MSAGSAARLLDELIEFYGMKNGAETARALKVAPSVISKVRRGCMPLGASLILAIHERFDILVAEIRQMSGAVAK